MSSASGVTDLVDDRIYPMVGPLDSKYPLITYERISGAPANALTGTPGRARVVIEVNAFALSASGALTLGEAARAAVTGLMLDSDLMYDPEFEVYRYRQEFSYHHALS